jgi:hypothetical protein
MTTPGIDAYATCQDCGVDLADRDAMTAHFRDTSAPTGEPGVTARSHRVRVVNPTEAEQQARQVRLRVQDALDEAFDALYEWVQRGDFTAAEVTKELSYFDLPDGWDEYVAEGES